MQKFKNSQATIYVKTIGEYAFANTTIESIEIPEGVLVEIPFRCFLNCTLLKEVKLPSTLKVISECAFDNTALDKIEIPDNFPDNLLQEIREVCPNIITTPTPSTTTEASAF